MFPLRDSNPSKSIPIVNLLFIATNILVFLFFETTLPEANLKEFITTYGLVPNRLLDNFDLSQFSTILSSMFLHGGWFHLISNMWALYIFGDNIEDRLGHIGYFFFYMICGIMAALAQAFALPSSSLPTVGASGAIAGVLGGYLLLFPRARIESLVPFMAMSYLVEIPAYVYLGFWFLSQSFTGVFSLGDAAANQGSIAWWAHIGGFVTGILLVRFFEKRQSNRQNEAYY